MRRFFALATTVTLLLGTAAFAQQKFADTEFTLGKVISINRADNTMKLDNGMEFTLAENLQYTSFPKLGQTIEVRYVERDGEKVAVKVHQEPTPGGGA